MKFEEIFNAEGLYIHRDMQEGMAARIDKIGTIDFVEYDTPSQITPNLHYIQVYKQCFQKDWKKVLTLYQLFGTKRHDLLNERTT